MENLPIQPIETPFPLSVSSGDAVTCVCEPYIVYTGSPEYEGDVLALLQEVQNTQALVLESNQRLELQNEASISILLIFLVVGTLNYIYKFFRMFF